MTAALRAFVAQRRDVKYAMRKAVSRAAYNALKRERRAAEAAARVTPEPSAERILFALWTRPADGKRSALMNMRGRL
jgi:hypothetical protein